MSHEIRDCTLEIDSGRGVIYVHGPTGVTLVRIGHLPTPVPTPNIEGLTLNSINTIDIAHMHGVNWEAAKEEG